MRVLLGGGGSGGSATPLLAVAEVLARRHPDIRFLYAGTSTGPEARLAKAAGIEFRSVQAGRWRRYWDWRNLSDVPRVAVGVAQALQLVARLRPDVAFGAGGFASVPPLLAAAACRVPVAIHQQDVEPGLANRLLAPVSAAITVVFQETSRFFPQGKTRVTGNPVRASVLRGSAEQGRRFFGLVEDLPTLLVMGGGTGALRLNRIVAEAAEDLAQFCQVVHLCGLGKMVSAVSHERYHPLEFLDMELPDVLAAADLVLCRAGMSTIAELSLLGKPAVLVPMPHSHQFANARAVEAAGGALMLEEATLTASTLANCVKVVLHDLGLRSQLAGGMSRLMPGNGAEVVASSLEGLAGLRTAAPASQT